MSVSVEAVRRRIKALERDVREFGDWMFAAGFYEPIESGTSWVDGRGVTHIAVPAKLTEKGRRAGVPYHEFTYDPKER